MDYLSNSGRTEFGAELMTKQEPVLLLKCPAYYEEPQAILVASRTLSSGGSPSQALGLVLNSS